MLFRSIMKTSNATLALFDVEYLEESKPVLENFLQRNLSLAEVEEFIQNFLELEELVRKLNKVPQE